MTGGRFRPPKIATGEKIGPYEVVELVADGGFGYLYRVRRDGKVYALKIGRNSFAGMIAEDRERDQERLDREIAAMKTLHHPNIVRVLAFDQWPDLEGGYPYLVMEFVEGQRLDEWQVANAPALSKVVALYERIALAVEHIHSHGIFHRDLKAQNVVVRDNGEPVILDFGIARPQYAHEVTRAGTIGSVTHYAPEYARWIDSAASQTEPFQWQAATDLHAFGYMIYEALTGQPPFPRGTQSKPAEEVAILLAIKKVIPKRPSTWNPKIPAALDDLVMQLLAKDPAQRPRSAGAVAEALRLAQDVARESGDKSWTEPLDLPASGDQPKATTPAMGAPLPGADRRDLGPPGAEPTEVPGSTHVEVIAEGGGAAPEPVSLPPPERAAEFIEAGDGAAAPPATAKSDGVDETIAALKAQVAASAPRSRASPILVGGLVVAVTIIAILFAGGLRSPVKEGARTLLSTSEAAGDQPRGPSSLAVVLPPAASGGQPDVAAAAETKPRLPGGALGPSRSDGEVLDPGLVRRNARSGASPGERIEPAYAPVPKPAALEAERSPLVVSQPISAESGPIQRSRRMDVATAAPPSAPKPRGVPYGSHIRARLLSNLDTRTIGSGPVEAILDMPHMVRGEIVLPVRTLVYGTATETAGRFTVRFNRLRLPDDTELAFEAIALARDDGKPGLAAARRIERPPEQREGVASRIAKGTGNILLDTITGGTPGVVARGAGQAVLNQEASQPPSNSQWALLLDAGVVFDLWVEHSF